MGIDISRGEALAEFRGWDDADRSRARLELERLDAARFVTPPSRQYVICYRADGTLVCWLNPGRIDYPKAYAPGFALPLHWAGHHGNGGSKVWAIPLHLGKPTQWQRPTADGPSGNGDG